MPILPNVKQETFCQNLCISLMEPIDAYINAGYSVKDRNKISVLACQMQKRSPMKERIAELMEKRLEKVEKLSIKNLHDDAVRKAKELLESDNPNVSAKMIDMILSRSEPVVHQSQSFNITVNSKDQERRKEILERKRLQVKAVDITPKELPNET